MNMKNKSNSITLGILLSAALLVIFFPSGKAYCREIKPLWLTLAPAKPSDNAEICEQHLPPAADTVKRKAAKKNGRPASSAGNRNPRYGGSGKPSRFESEHRPMPKRNYWLNLNRPTPGLKAYIMRPDGAVETTTVQPLLAGVQVQVDTPMGDGPAHGANNVYVVDRHVVDDVLVVRTAKWLTIHHNCGWGHDHKFDEIRQTSQANRDIPLEIVIDNLWDTNFHSRVMSGDELHIRLLSNGRPVSGAKLTVTSDKGWSKKITSGKDGAARLQLIRDYYPAGWLSFKREKKSAFKVLAEYEKAEPGVYQDSPYSRVLMSSTFSWRYYPARQEYHSYAWGLGIALVFSLVSGLGVYIHRERRKKPMREIVFDE